MVGQLLMSHMSFSSHHATRICRGIASASNKARTDARENRSVRRLRIALSGAKTLPESRNLRISEENASDTVSQALQKVCDLYLFNLCKEINRLCGHHHKKTITKDILREALKTFHLELFSSCRARLPVA